MPNIFILQYSISTHHIYRVIIIKAIKQTQVRPESSFDNQQQHLLAGISVAVRPFFQLNILSKHELMNLLLYGDEDLPSDVNKRVIEYTLNFIHETGRFN